MKSLLAATVLGLLLGSALPLSAQHTAGIETPDLNTVRSRLDSFTRKFLDTVIAQPLFSRFQGSYADKRFDTDQSFIRRQELGLQHGYFVDWKNQWNVYAINDTIIALTALFGSESPTPPQRIIYNREAWERWHAGIDSMYGSVDSLPIDSASLSDYELLTSLSQYYPLGYSCGPGGTHPAGYCAAARLFCRKDTNALRRVLRAPNLEGRIYALAALKTWDRKGSERLHERLGLFTRELSKLEGDVRTCSGCIFEDKTPAEAIATKISFEGRTLAGCPGGECGE